MTPFFTDPMITQHDARTVLGTLGMLPGWTPGGFESDLVRAMLHADTTNRALLAIPYPGLMAAVVRYKDDDEGYQYLQVLADFDRVDI